MEFYPYDPSRHNLNSVAAQGICSWHGYDTCKRRPLVSFKDEQGRRQSGCLRAILELADRGLVRS